MLSTLLFCVAVLCGIGAEKKLFDFGYSVLEEKLGDIDGKFAEVVDRLEQLDSKLEVMDDRMSEMERKLIKLHPPSTCSGIKRAIPTAHDGVYRLQLSPYTSFDGYCRFEEDGNWLVILRRQDNATRFPGRSWQEYKDGFGSKARNFWLGNSLLHLITTRSMAALKIEMKGVAVPSHNVTAATKHVRYSTFSVGSEAEKYKLTIGGFTGDVYYDSMKYHNGMKFSTVDQDNDQDSSVNCALNREGAWWYKNCVTAHLTGDYLKPGWHPSSHGNGIWWDLWEKRKKGFSWYQYKLEFVEMKVQF